MLKIEKNVQRIECYPQRILKKISTRPSETDFTRVIQTEIINTLNVFFKNLIFSAPRVQVAGYGTLDPPLISEVEVLLFRLGVEMPPDLIL